MGGRTNNHRLDFTRVCAKSSVLLSTTENYRRTQVSRKPCISLRESETELSDESAAFLTKDGGRAFQEAVGSCGGK
jgi:hypothetical protein